MGKGGGVMNTATVKHAGSNFRVRQGGHQHFVSSNYFTHEEEGKVTNPTGSSEILASIS